MRFATIRVPGGTKAVLIEGENATELEYSSVGELLSNPSWQREFKATKVVRKVDGLDYATLIPSPSKVICVGHNYKNHIKEMGRELPTHPTLFAKFAEALIGANDTIYLSSESSMYDWEAELGVIIGKTTRSCSEKDARDSIAGFTVINDVTARDWQNRTLQWLQGKTFEGSTPVGPNLVTMDVDKVIEEGLALSCEVNGEEMQHSVTSDLLFNPVFLVSYISKILTLRPGDVIATGTPGGVGHARNPQRYLEDGDILVTRVEGVGELRNICKSA